MTDRDRVVARQRRRRQRLPPPSSEPTPPSADARSDAARGGRPNNNIDDRGSKRREERRRTTASQKRLTATTIIPVKMSRDVVSLTTPLLDTSHHHHHLELQASSQHDEENLSPTKQQLLASSKSSSSTTTSTTHWTVNWRRWMHQNVTTNYFRTTSSILEATATTTTTAPRTKLVSCFSSFALCGRGSTRLLAFMSHFCFILASSLYIQLSFVERNWIFIARDQYQVPNNVFDADDDLAWHNWETSSYAPAVAFHSSADESDNESTKNIHHGRNDELINFNIDNNEVNNKNNNIVIDNNNFTTTTLTTNMNDDDIGYDPILENIRKKYNYQSTSLQIYASLFFVMVGIFDWLRYRDTMNVFMIFAGGAGMASGMATTSSNESVWNCVSVHIYLLEAYNLSHRERKTKSSSTTLTTTSVTISGSVTVNDWANRCIGRNTGKIENIAKNHSTICHANREEEKHLFLKVGNTCFLVGCILDVLGSYVDLAGAQGLWVIYADMTSNFLWLECALIELGAEIYYLHHTTRKTCILVQRG